MTDYNYLINDDGEEFQEEDELILPVIEQELIDRLRDVFPDSVKICTDKSDLDFMKGAQAVIDFIEEQKDKQNNRGV